jgi:hypothetical protein
LVSVAGAQGSKGLAGASREIPSILLPDVVVVLHGELRIVPAPGALAGLAPLPILVSLIQYNLYRIKDSAEGPPVAELGG